MSMTPDKLKAMFMDLGKATKRGIRKCPQCGTVNGTRGMQCKNRECEFVFKEGNKKPDQTSSSSVKVVTGSSVQVFSVRLRDRGPDFRGFVQLPLIQDLDGNPAENIDPAIMLTVLSSAAKCYVDVCPRSKQQNPPEGGSTATPVCTHIKTSVNCNEEAQPLTLKNSVLNALDVGADVKEDIWLLATETAGPLVQRATKNTFVIKCKPSMNHPLGFLHFAFYPMGTGVKGSAKDGGSKGSGNKFFCSCKHFRSQPKPVYPTDDNKKRCIHFYACISSLASDETLSKEYESIISLVKFNEIIPEALETTVIFGNSNTASNMLIKGIPQEVESSNISEFVETYSVDGSDGAVDAGGGGTAVGLEGHIEQVIEHHMLEEVQHSVVDNVVEGGGIEVGGSALATEPHFEDTEEDVVNDEEEITLEETQVSAVLEENAAGMGGIVMTSGENSIIISGGNLVTAEAVMSQAGEEEQTLGNLGQVDNIEVIVDDNNQIVSIAEPPLKRCKMENMVFVSEASDTLAAASSALLTLQEAKTATAAVVPNTAVSSAMETTVLSSTHHQHSATSSPDFRLMAKKSSQSKPALQKPALKKAPTEEGNLQVTFHQWLASVTERINQTMHYQFDGTPEPLVFHAPQVFFDSLQARISAGSKKKRLPNSTTGFIRRDALPLGTFTKYTWHITNILHVKQIFDTPDLHLDITRSFVENKDGTYDLYDKAKDSTVTPGSEEKNNYLPIRPFELKTYLKVGHTSANQKEATPFVIEWIPDILPKSRIGELRIKFEYGHQRNGYVEHRAPVGSV